MILPYKNAQLLLIAVTESDPTGDPEITDRFSHWCVFECIQKSISIICGGVKAENFTDILHHNDRIKGMFFPFCDISISGLSLFSGS